jgi:cofilin
MAMSGVELDPQCKLVYDEVQSKKKHRYVTFKIDDGKIRVDKIGERDNTYDMFLTDLCVKDGDADDCRYAIYDYEYVVNSQGTEPSNRSKLFMVCWCPDSARIKKKMVYAASFDSLKKSFTGVQKIINANGFDEVEQAYIEDILKSSSRT